MMKKNSDQGQIILATRYTRWILYSGAIGLILILVGAVWSFLPEGWDWPRYFSPAIREMLVGRSPYTIDGFFNPPWTLIPLFPLIFLPSKLASAIISVAGMIVFAYSAHRFGIKPIGLAAFLLSPPVLYGAFSTNIDWYIPLGFLLPPQIGLFFILSKPQIGAAGALFILIDHWRMKGLRSTIAMIFPVSIAFILSFILFGFWPRFAINRIDHGVNVSLWPYSIPFGVVILLIAFRMQRKSLAISSSPFLSPYVSPHSWAIALFGLFSSPIGILIAVIAMWAVAIFQGTFHIF